MMIFRFPGMSLSFLGGHMISNKSWDHFRAPKIRFSKAEIIFLYIPKDGGCIKRVVASDLFFHLNKVECIHNIGFPSLQRKNPCEPGMSFHDALTRLRLSKSSPVFILISNSQYKHYLKSGYLQFCISLPTTKSVS